MPAADETASRSRRRRYGPAMIRILALSALSIAVTPQSGQPETEPEHVREIDAIDCRLDVPGYNGFAMAVTGEDLARKRHWRKIAGSNPFMSEYELPAPIVVAGSYRTRRIAFTSDSIVAVLDLADPAVIARAEKIENAMDAEPMIAALTASGKATRAQVEAEIQFRKFLGERIVKDVTEPAAQGESFGSRMIIARSISNTTTHPGKTLYGCSYRMELLDRDGKPL